MDDVHGMPRHASRWSLLTSLSLLLWVQNCFADPGRHSSRNAEARSEFSRSKKGGLCWTPVSGRVTSGHFSDVLVIASAFVALCSSSWTDSRPCASSLKPQTFVLDFTECKPTSNKALRTTSWLNNLQQPPLTNTSHTVSHISQNLFRKHATCDHRLMHEMCREFQRVSLETGLLKMGFSAAGYCGLRPARCTLSGVESLTVESRLF